jgi:hypothetical protein
VADHFANFSINLTNVSHMPIRIYGPSEQYIVRILCAIHKETMAVSMVSNVSHNDVI